MEVSMISSLSVKAFSKEYKKAVCDIVSRIKNFNGKDKEIAVELIEHCLEYDDGEYIIDCVLEKDKVIGYICYGEASLTEGVYEVYYIAVDPVYQGKGIGKFLMESVEKKLKPKARMIHIETSSDKTYLPTQKFYEKLNYKEIARIRDFYKVGEDKILYEKRLK